jgi:hypothetical protein
MVKNAMEARFELFIGLANRTSELFCMFADGSRLDVIAHMLGDTTPQFVCAGRRSRVGFVTLGDKRTWSHLWLFNLRRGLFLGPLRPLGTLGATQEFLDLGFQRVTAAALSWLGALSWRRAWAGLFPW